MLFASAGGTPGGAPFAACMAATATSAGSGAGPGDSGGAGIELSSMSAPPSPGAGDRRSATCNEASCSSSACESCGTAGVELGLSMDSPSDSAWCADAT